MLNIGHSVGPMDPFSSAGVYWFWLDVLAWISFFIIHCMWEVMYIDIVIMTWFDVSLIIVIQILSCAYYTEYSTTRWLIINLTFHNLSLATSVKHKYNSQAWFSKSRALIWCATCPYKLEIQDLSFFGTYLLNFRQLWHFNLIF